MRRKYKTREVGTLNPSLLSSGDSILESSDFLEGISQSGKHLNGSLVAAIDLGSNSFHLISARVVKQELQIVDRQKDPVRLAAGLKSDNTLNKASQKRAIESLKRFRQSIGNIEAKHVRVVGTNTLRQARNRADFVQKASKALGHQIEIISGQEEARLIYLGVAHTIAAEDQRRLVVDIGGGSTECILGEGFESLEAHSLFMGCVTWTKQFFGDDKITAMAFKRAELAALQELGPILETYKGMGWDQAIGSSGTFNAIQSVLKANGWADEGITDEGLFRLRKKLIEAGAASKLDIEGLKSDRAVIFAGGVAIASAIFDGFGIEQMDTSGGALREGVLYDLLGRIRHEDRRELTIRRFGERYHIDDEHAERVESTARMLLQQCVEAWKLDEANTTMLAGWAAQLHEIGKVICYSGYHKHGAYLVRHSDMPGFSQDDQELLAVLIRCHRRKLIHEIFEDLAPGRRKIAKRLCLILRLAVLLNRSRNPHPLPRIKVRAKSHKLHLEFPDGWLDSQPLTHEDLIQEASWQKRIDMVLSYA